jgi:hypothetical protein
MINWELTLAVCGLLIALSASVATIWQGKLTRQHNRLSVKPILSVEGTAVINEPVSIILKNTGLGPAIIKSYALSVDGKRISAEIADPQLEAMRQAGLGSHLIRFYSFGEGDTIAQGESHSLFETVSPQTVQKSIDQIKSAFNRVSVHVNYTSIYGEEHELNASHIMAP